MVSWAQELIYLHLTSSLRSEWKSGQSGDHGRVVVYLWSLPDNYENLKRKSTLLALTLSLLMWKIWWAPNNASRLQVGFNSAFKGLSETNFGPVKYKGSLRNVHFLRQKQNLWLCVILNVGTVLPVSFVHYMYSIWLAMNGDQEEWRTQNVIQISEYSKLKYVCKNPLFCLLLIRTDNRS